LNRSFYQTLQIQSASLFTNQLSPVTSSAIN